MSDESLFLRRREHRVLLGCVIQETFSPRFRKRFSPDEKGVGGPAGSEEAAKRRTEAIRTVGPTLIKGTMPIYEYECSGCGHRFEYLVLPSSPTPECPECQHKDLKRLISLCAVSSESSR